MASGPPRRSRPPDIAAAHSIHRQRARRPTRPRIVTLHRVTEYRVVFSLTASTVGGALGLHAYPFPADHPVLALIHVTRPALYAGCTYAYAGLWFTSTFFVASIGMSFVIIFYRARGSGDRHGSASAVSSSRTPRRALPGARRTASSDLARARCSALVARDSGTRSVHRRPRGAIAPGKTSACM